MKPLHLRVLLWIFSRLLYRVKVLGPGNVPAQGGALMVSNHVSYVDMLLILASTRRSVRFLIAEEVCALWFLKPLLRLFRVIPLPPELSQRELVKTLHKAANLIRAGEVVGIFAERNITRIGVMLRFHREFERIMDGLDAPVIPVCLDGVWGSIFSYHAGRFFWKLPRRLPYPVTVSFGKPMPSSSTASEVRKAIQALNTDAWAYRRRIMKPLGRAFVSCARHHPFRFAMADSRVPGLSFGTVLTKTLFLARRLRPHWQGQRMVGIFLPSSVGCALVNLAALIAGKVPVNLNYTLSAETLASCARQCGLQTIISSKQFLERVKTSLPAKTLFLEDIADKPGVLEKLSALALTWLVPVRCMEKTAGCGPSPRLDDLGMLVFSSGSTGEPKGIMLSHYNLVSNIAQLGQTFDFGARDRFVGILPLFHSFGLTATLLVPAVCGIGVVFHPNPLDGRPVGELVRRYRLTYLMATPVFLQIYLRTCEPEHFGSLRLVMTGSAKLTDKVSADFESRFGLRPVEGYGCTECSPVVAANTHDYRSTGIFETGTRRGGTGQPMPGMSLKIVDPDDFTPMPGGKEGLLLVRGPNVMLGYLNRPDKTAEVLRDGWYNTGDIALIDQDGFLQITDRRSRFSKIGGEMVPHIKVEETLHRLAAVPEPAFAVSGVPDEQKGERLVVLHTLADAALAEVLARLPASGLPNLWIPRANQFFHIDAIPLLGSGRPNLQEIKKLARSLSKEPSQGLAPAQPSSS